MRLLRYVKAVLREITKLWAIRDRSVVRSSVTPSAKYCWSGSLLRLVNGSTTIERRGATRGCARDVAAATDGVDDGFVASQSHHAPAAMIRSPATAAAGIVTREVRPRRGAATGILAVG